MPGLLASEVFNNILVNCDTMPSRHERKVFTSSGVYHTYNRSVNKATIFHEPYDYQYFVECMMIYLIPHTDLYDSLILSGYSKERVISILRKVGNLKNYSNEINLAAFCVMPNHFHLLLQQKNTDGMGRFIKSLLTRYAMYYARKYDHSGPVFQGRYKAIPVKNSIYGSIVLDYIHMNPADLPLYRMNPMAYPWSSAQDYSNRQTPRTWIKTARS